MQNIQFLSLCHVTDHLQDEEKGMGILGGCSHPGVCCLLLTLQQENTRECQLWLTFNPRKNHRFHCKALEISEKVHLHFWILDKLQFYLFIYVESSSSPGLWSFTVPGSICTKKYCTPESKIPWSPFLFALSGLWNNNFGRCVIAVALSMTKDHVAPGLKLSFVRDTQARRSGRHRTLLWRQNEWKMSHWVSGSWQANTHHFILCIGVKTASQLSQEWHTQVPNGRKPLLATLQHRSARSRYVQKYRCTLMHWEQVLPKLSGENINKNYI